ncbi:hypothetical protein RRF57_008018 [Xylaria bambusicola]|uniref:Uncharacterized protein n=1 Tax=Xylaria bambusicola TaxID=326684 RepID=A0AAN7URD8_9PEZI
MAVALLPYNPQHYDSLPPVIQAGRNAEPSGAIDALSSVIGPIFVKHGVLNELGIILLHNHFELGASELLVQFGNAAVPWETSRNSSGLEHVLPAAWRFVDDGLAPYEFIYAKNHQTAVPILTQERHSGFLKDLRAVLEERALLSVLGLCLLENKDIAAPAMFEVESGRSTITVDVDINPQKEDWFIHVIWQFGTSASKFVRLS